MDIHIKTALNKFWKVFKHSPDGEKAGLLGKYLQSFGSSVAGNVGTDSGQIASVLSDMVGNPAKLPSHQSIAKRLTRNLKNSKFKTYSMSIRDKIDDLHVDREDRIASKATGTPMWKGYSGNDMVPINHGGSKEYLERFLSGRHKGYPLEGGGLGIQVHPNPNPALDDRVRYYADRAARSRGGTPAILTGLINRKYLTAAPNSYEAGVRGIDFDKIQNASIEALKPTPKGGPYYSHNKDIRAKDLGISKSQLMSLIQDHIISD